MPVASIPDLPDNLILDTDSYKLSHWKQYTPGTTRMMSYFESRGGPFGTATLFGFQYLLHRYLSKPVTAAMVEEAELFAINHGEPFNKAGWTHIVEKYGGKLPLKIRAIPEGLQVPTRNALMTIEVDDPECFWLTSWMETMLVRLWYPSTIATTSRESKKILVKYLQETSDADAMAEVMFKLHDFGSRGVTTVEQARLGGAAHLTNFLGSDTIEGVRLANHYYDCAMAGFSIPASEHSTVTMWGRDKEYEMFDHYVETYLVGVETPPGVPKLAACVSDTYNVFEAVKAWTSDPLKSKIKASGGTIVIRPDSGDPKEVLTEIFHILADQLGDEVTINSKGFRVLPSWVRVIQGDGIDMASMEDILRRMVELKWSTENLAFGSGGGLLQKVNRDTQKWAFKCCAALVDGEWRDVRKDPVTDKGKQSKAGRLDLIRRGGKYETIALPEGSEAHPESVMRTVFDHGEILVHHTFDEIRERMAL
jgi:nicotinamide phosphoribosyltransferase